MPVGPRGAAGQVADAAAALALYAAAGGRAGEVDAVDVVPAARTVLFDGVRDVERLAAAAVDLARCARPPRTPRRCEVPTSYDGADLDDVARLWDMTREEVVAHPHRAPGSSVAFCGFAPGFAYCTGLPDRLAVPRLDDAPAPGPGRLGRAGRPVHRGLPDQLAGRLAAARPHRRWPCGTRPATPRRAGARHPGRGSSRFVVVIERR